MRNVGAFMGFKGVFGRGKNGFWKFEGPKMVNYVNLPRVYQTPWRAPQDPWRAPQEQLKLGRNLKIGMGFSMLFFGLGVRIAFPLFFLMK